MDKSEDCDSDGSISWEDFFGSSTDLVPTLLTMYDSLIAQSLSDDLASNHVPSDQVRWASSTMNTRTNMSLNSMGTPPPSPLSLETKRINTTSTTSTTDYNSSNAREWTSANGTEASKNQKMETNSNANNNNKTIFSSRNSVNQQQQLRYGITNRSLSRWSARDGEMSNGETPTNNSTSTRNSSHLPNTNGNHKLIPNGCNGKEQRPLSVNSVLSSTSSSSCSSESSTSLSNVLGLAPRASPEEEDCATIPDADISDDDETTAIKTNYRCAKTNDQMNGTDRCFSNSAAKDCGENASRNSRISYPIMAQGKPRFCDPNMSYMDRVVMEIVETERIYVTDLREIISGYLEHWRLQPDESLSLNDITELFSNIEEIHKFNGEFLTQLEGCDLNPVQVARCFVTKNEGFSIYTQYCTNYPRTMSILTEMMRHEQSAKSFRERQASLGHTLPLGSYLLKPVQRILKYHLLLQNIVKHYDHGAEGYEAIVEALSAMTNIAHHINDMKRRHEHAVRVQEIQSLLYGWQGEDLTTYGELCAEGTFRVYGAKALRHVFLFDKMVLITKKKEDGILSYKSHIMCSNLMLIESVPGEPLSFHVIPFDNPRFQCTLQARNLEQKREWTLQLKRVILENYHAVIPTHARQLVMELGQSRPEDEGISEKAPTKRQHSAPEYLERRKQEKERRKSESTLKARLRRARKSDPISPKESPAACRRSRRTSIDSSRERSESRDREVAIDRKMSSASCPSSGTTEKRLVKKLSGWRRKSEPGFYLHQSGRKTAGGKGASELMSPQHGTSNLTLDSNESIGEEGGEEEEDESASQIDLCSEENELDEVDESCLPNVEERRESIEEIVGQLVMQNREFQRILSKQRLVHLRKALAQHQQRHLHEEETASETETEDHHQHERIIRANSERVNKKSIQDSSEKLSGSGASQISSSNGIGSSSELNENSSENISIGANDDEVMHSSKNVQRTVSDPGNKATLTPRRFISGPFAHYDPLSLLWSSFRRSDTRSNNQGNSSVNSKGKTNIRHTHSFTCSHKESINGGTESETKEPLPITHGDSGVFPNSFTSDSSSSSEANIPTLPAVWLKQQDAHLATPNNKSGSLPRSFQVGQHTMPMPKAELSIKTISDNLGFKSRLRDGKYADRPFTIASDKPSPSDISFDEMEQYMSKFNDQMVGRNSSNSLSVTEDVDDLATELTPVTSIENISLHPDHKIYRSSKSSIKHMLLSVTHRLSGLKANMLASSGNGGSGSNRGALAFGSYPNIATTADNHKDSDRTPHQSNQQQHNGDLPFSNGHGKVKGGGNSTATSNTSAIFRNNYKKSLKQKIRHIVKEDRDSDSENCESVTCSSNGSSGFGSLGSCGSSTNNLTSKIGARLAQSSEHSDYALSKLLGSALNESLNRRPHSVMSVSSTVTSTSSTDEKTSSGVGEESLSESNGESSHNVYRSGRKAINHRDLYLSYIDQEGEGALSDSDASADSFYERSFEAIENFLESEMFPDSAIYSGDENASSSNSSARGSRGTNWPPSSSLDDNESLCATVSSLCSSSLHSSDLNSISALASRLSNTKLLVANSQSIPNANGISLDSKANSNDDNHRRSRLVRSQVILEKLKHLEQCSQFHRDEPPSPSFEGIKSIQERRKELDLWRVGMANREDESETSSQHSTSTINTVIELSLSPSKSTSIPSSRRCSDTDSSGGNSPLTERAISRNGNHSQSQGDLGEPMPKGWVKLVVGKLEAET